MNTKLVMIASSGLLGLLGLLMIFLPQEIGASIEGVAAPVFLQLLGASYFAFAMANWTAKASILGGIYGRALTLANFIHFAMAGVSLVKSAFVAHLVGGIITALFLLFAALFGVMLFRHPTLRQEKH